MADQSCFALKTAALAAAALRLFAGCDAPSLPTDPYVSVIGVPGIAPKAVVPACVSALVQGGSSPVCASCVCGRCPETASTCKGDASCVAQDSCVVLDCNTQCSANGAQCSFEDEACQERRCGPIDAERERARASSAKIADVPVILQVFVNGALAWSLGTSLHASVQPRDRIALVGSGFGAGTDVDFAKIMIGNSRVLETDLTMYEQELDIAHQLNYETATVRSSWPRDVISWSPTRVEFYAPVHVSRGPLRMQVQKRIGRNASLLRLGESHQTVDAQTLRIHDASFPVSCDVISELGAPVASNLVPIDVINPDFQSLLDLGRKIFWSYDFNIGLTHNLRGLNWDEIFAGSARDPLTGAAVEPAAFFGAIPAVRGEVPDEALDPVTFDPYPQKNPIPGQFLTTPQLTSGTTRTTGWVGFRYAESSHPIQGIGSWIGFNCASCHGYRVEYERAPNERVSRVVPGLPNPNWTMKWAMLGNFVGVRGTENGPLWQPGQADIDKSSLLYAMPPGTGEHTIVRLHGEGSAIDNDYQFSPIAIPNVTNYMAIRRSLSHSESYVGFEGSYIHSEEPDGALGSMDAPNLQALTAYMTTLDQFDGELRNVGLYRWIKYKGALAGLTGSATIAEGQFVKNGWQSYPVLASRVALGKATFGVRCGACHSDTLGANSNERMIRLDQVGRFFSPTVYERHTQAIRVTFLRDLYFTQHRGLLSDGHVRNLEDLVSPDRCREGSSLYNRYYTLHAPTAALPPPGPDFPALHIGESPRGDVFVVARATEGTATAEARNRFVERHLYFTTLPEDPAHYYYDYQRMRREYGPRELGTAAPIGMPAAPHPWCAGSANEVPDLLLYLLTL